MSRLSVIFFAVVFISGCVVGPDYQRPAALPSAAVPSTFSTPTNAVATNEWKVAEPSAGIPRDAWWGMFEDQELNRLEQLAAGENQELAGFAARLEQARRAIDISRSDLFPHLSVAPSFARQRTSANAFERDGKTISSTYNTYSLPLEAGWEIDLWGRVRRGVEASRARLAAVADDVESARLALQAEIAVDFFTLRSLDAEQRILAQTVDAYQKSLDLTRNRRAGGVATDLDVAQAEAQLRGAEGQIPAVALDRAKTLHALATLCGQPATSFSVATNAARLSDPILLASSLPSELLERRPDVAAGERRMAAANAGIGIAKAAFYPRVELTGLAGVASISAGSIFSWPSRLWAIGPSIDLPIFNAGLNRAQLAVARAAYDETVAAYRQTVLSAFQEVEDQLASQQLLSSQLESEVAAMQASQRSLEIANNRYRAGLVTYLEVSTAQSAALGHERTVIHLRAERLIASAALVKAAGGSVGMGR